MKPIFISAENILNKGKEYLDLSPKTAKLTAIAYPDIHELKDLLALAFYGNGIEGIVELGYEYNGEEYIVKRDFSGNTASLTCADSGLEINGAEDVDKRIGEQIKLEKSSFAQLAVVERDRIFDSFQLPAANREEFIDNLLVNLLCNKEEISTIENKVREKYDKAMLRLDIAEEVNPKELSDLKAEINEKHLMRQEIRREMDILYDVLRKAQAAEQAAVQLAAEQAELDKAEAKRPLIDELNTVLAKSREAALLNTLYERKKLIADKNAVAEARLKELDELAVSGDRDIQNGEKSVKNAEGVLIHCIARIDELRKALYKRVEELASDGNYQNKINGQVEQFYSKENERLAALNQRRMELNDESEAVVLSIKDLESRRKEIARPAELKRAIREGSVLEKEIALLREIISGTEQRLKVAVADLEKLIPEIYDLGQTAASEELAVQKLDAFLLNGYGTAEEALAAAAAREQEFRKSGVLVKAYEQELDAIALRIQDNEKGLTSYKEDMDALSKAKAGLDAYIKKVKDAIAAQKKSIEELEVDQKYVTRMLELEYGEKCPLCDAVVLKKNLNQKRIEDLNAQLDKAYAELKKSEDILAEYEERGRQINFRNGELSTRIRISEAYLKSLADSLDLKKDYIRRALLQADAKNSFELSEKIKDAEHIYAQLRHAAKKHLEISGSLKMHGSRLEELNALKLKLAEEVIPKLNIRIRDAKQKLEDAESAFSQHEALLGGVAACDRLEETTLIEKESDTIEAALSDKRAKLEELTSELQKVEGLINLLASRRQPIVLGGKEYEYQQVIIRTIGADFDEIVDEIRKSEEEATQVKTKLAAIKKVLARKVLERGAARTESDILQTRLEADREVLEQVISDFDGAARTLMPDDPKSDPKAVKRLVLTDAQTSEIEREIERLLGDIAVRKTNVDRLKALLAESGEILELKDENKAALQALNEKHEDLCQKAAFLTAKRADLKSRAKQLISLKERAAKYKEKLKSLGDINRLLKDKGDIGGFIVKLASKRLYSLTKGRYNLDIIDGDMELLDNGNGGKRVPRDSYGPEEKLLIALVLGTSLNKTLIDMVGGEPFTLMFPLKERENNKEIALALTAYSKKEPFVAVAQSAEALSEIENIG